MQKTAVIFCIFCALHARDVNFSENFANVSDLLATTRENFKISQEKSGHYVEIGVGTSGLLLHQRQILKNPQNVPVLFLTKGGTQSFFGENLGVRGFFALDFYTNRLNFHKKIPQNDIFFTFFSLGIDLMLDFDTSQNTGVGGFFGVGFGANGIFSAESKIFVANVIVQSGLFFRFFSQKISLAAKVTPIQRGNARILTRQTDILPFLMWGVKF